MYFAKCAISDFVHCETYTLYKSDYVVCAERADDAERKLAEAEVEKVKLENDVAELEEKLAEMELGRNTARNDLANAEKILATTANRLAEKESLLDATEQRAIKAEQKLTAIASDADDEITADNGGGEASVATEDSSVVCESGDADQATEPNPCCVRAVKYV